MDADFAFRLLRAFPLELAAILIFWLQIQRWRDRREWWKTYREQKAAIERIEETNARTRAIYERIAQIDAETAQISARTQALLSRDAHGLDA